MSPNRSKTRGSSQAKLQGKLPSQTSKISNDQTNHVLFLKQSHVTFEAPTQRVSVFFDECNREIISLTSGIESSKTKVVFQATDGFDRVQLLLPVEKRILSIKFNPTHTVLAYHVEKSNIEFINVKSLIPGSLDSASTSTTNEIPVACELDDKRYVQSCRTKNSKLFGFLWTGPMELVMITDNSIEYYHVDSSRRRLRHLKSFQSTTNWFVYQPSLVKSVESSSGDQGDQGVASSHSSVLMVSTGSIGNSIQPYMFTRGQIIKLQRFDVEGNWHGSDKLELFERSITIASIYGCVRLLVLQHESLNLKSRGAQILIYTVDHESGITSKTHTLDLDISGRFAINILDNLIVAHDQPSKSSFIFDIIIESTEKSDCPRHFVSLINGQPLKPMCLTETDTEVDMYSLNWVFFQPDFIIDAKLGLLFTLHLDLVSIQDTIKDNFMLLNFLAHRSGSERIILSKCKAIVENCYKAPVVSADSGSTQIKNPLADVSSAFEILGKLVISAPEIERKSAAEASKQGFSIKTMQTTHKEHYAASIAQEDVQREVFRQLETNAPNKEDLSGTHFVASTLLEFIFVIRREEKNVEFCIYEQLLKCLVNGKRFYQLVQMIRSEIFKDSKQLACLLLSLRAEYPPAEQLGLDMLQRLDCLPELIESLCLSPGDSADLHSDSTTNRLAMALLQQSVEIDAT